jgi:Kef-type K+ transport system membrane component KefB
MELFLELTSIIVLATIISVIFKFLKQPLIFSYIFTGVLLGPYFLNTIKTTDYISLFSNIGITILLFIVGLNLKPSVVKEVGKVSLLGGIGQILLTTILGCFISFLLGISFIHSLYIGLALSFSSTIVILKLLSDKNDLPKVYGKVTVGILVVQDIVAILSLLLISSFAGTHTSNILDTSTVLILKLVVSCLCVYLVSKYLLSYAIHHLAQSQEILFLFSIAWGLGFASIFYLLGFSVEIGSLIAGVSLSLTPFADSIASKLKPLRDFFIVLFFILLGSSILVANIPQLLFTSLFLSFFVLLIKPFIVFILMNLLGYKTKQGFQTGISLAQVSEFSLILAALGLSIGQLDAETASLITVTALITIAGSSYFILYSDEIYPYIEKLLKKCEINHVLNKRNKQELQAELILFGYDRVGHDFIEAFNILGKKYLVVDYNPDVISQLELDSIPFIYGDVEDIEFLHELQFDKVKLCVSTIPDVKVNSLLIKKIKKENEHVIIIVRAREISEAKILYELGATYVVMPHYLGAQYAAAMIKRIGLDKKGFYEERDKHFSYINKVK